MLLDINSFKKGDLYVSFKTVEEFKKGITILETYGFKFSGNEETIYLVEEKITKDPRNRVFFKTYEGNKFYYAAIKSNEFNVVSVSELEENIDDEKLIEDYLIDIFPSVISVELERDEVDMVISLDLEVEENLPKLKKAVEEFCCDNDIYFERILIEL